MVLIFSAVRKAFYMSSKISISIVLLISTFSAIGQTSQNENLDYVRYNAGYRIIDKATSDTITINKAADNLTLLRYFGQQAEDDLALYQAAFNVLSSGLGKGYRDVAADATVKKLIKEKGLKLFGGPMLGNITPDGISVWVRTTAPASVKVILKDKQGKETSFGPVHSGWESELTAIIPVHGLYPQVLYKASLFIDDEKIALDQDFSIRLPAVEEGKEITRIAFGSCYHRWGLGNENLAKAIKNRNPEALLLNGDIAAQDRNNHAGMHRADYLMRDFFSSWKYMVASVPVYAVWDDHDYFDDDLAGIPEGFTQADKEIVWDVFRESWNNPSYGIGKESKGVFFSTRIGPCDVIMTDNRYFRDSETSTFLGEEQMAWIEEQLLSSKGPFIILASGTMWSDNVSAGKDSWGSWDPEGRERIFSFIEKNNIPGVLLISGDRHGARVFTIPRPFGFQFYEFEPASLGGRMGPPATHPDWGTQLFGISGKYAFGEFEFDTSVDDPEVTFRLIGDDNLVLYELKLKRSQLDPSKY
jgi:alkaline phosphatase D